MQLYEQVKELITKRQTSSNNSSGTRLNYISKCLNINMQELKPILNQLYKDNYLILRQGINEKLIFLKNYMK